MARSFDQRTRQRLRCATMALSIFLGGMLGVLSGTQASQASSLPEPPVGYSGFAAPLVYHLDGIPTGVVAGDLGNGHQDLVAAVTSSSEGAQIAVLMGAGNGTYAAPIYYSLDAEATYGVAVGDFNGKGRDDVAVLVGPANGEGGMSLDLVDSLPGGSLALAAMTSLRVQHQSSLTTIASPRGGFPWLVSGPSDFDLFGDIYSNDDGTFTPQLFPVGFAGYPVEGEFTQGVVSLAMGNFAGATGSLQIAAPDSARIDTICGDYTGTSFLASSRRFYLMEPSPLGVLPGPDADHFVTQQAVSGEFFQDQHQDLLTLSYSKVGQLVFSHFVPERDVFQVSNVLDDDSEPLDDPSSVAVGRFGSEMEPGVVVASGALDQVGLFPGNGHGLSSRWHVYTLPSQGDSKVFGFTSIAAINHSDRPSDIAVAGPSEIYPREKGYIEVVDYAAPPVIPPPAPVVSAVAPDSGAFTGGTLVEITGSNLSGAGVVRFGDVDAESFHVLSDQEILAVSPASKRAGEVPVTVVTPGGTSAEESKAEFLYEKPDVASLPETLLPVSPKRICDTRKGNPSGLYGSEAQCNGREVKAGQPYRIRVAGLAGVPRNGVASVIMNVTVLDPVRAGRLYLYAADRKVPSTSFFTFRARENGSELVSVPLSAHGAVEVLSSSSVNLLVDVEGYGLQESGASFSGADPYEGSSSGKVGVESEVGHFLGAKGLLFTPLEPKRICDTRKGNPSGLYGPEAQCNGREVKAGQPYRIRVAGLAGVPANATAAFLHLTITGAKKVGFAVLYGGGTTRPMASDLEIQPRAISSNTVLAPIGEGGYVNLYSSAASEAIVDVEGYFSPSGAGLLSTMVNPVAVSPGAWFSDPVTRACSSSCGQEQACALDQRTSCMTRVQLRGSAFLPSGASAVLFHVSVGGDSTPGYLTAFACGAVPMASDLNWSAEQSVSGVEIAKLSSSGSLCLYSSSGRVKISVEILGWFAT